QQVIIATPTTLISLLKAVSYGWKQEALAENAKKISELGSDLYERINVFINHFADIGKSLDKSVDVYNKAVSSLESRVLVSTRKFKELGIHNKNNIDTLEVIEKTPREIQVPELLPPM
ncbi:MAG: hypothetical protein ACD_79C00102G0001, partial [uncultured bacterium]